MSGDEKSAYHDLAQYQYYLPPELIAQYPAEPRDSSRLLVVERQSGAMYDRCFTDLVGYLHPGDVLVLNDTKVIPARLLGVKESGGQVEILLLRKKDSEWEALVKPARRLRPGYRILFPGFGGVEAVITSELDFPGGRRLLLRNCDEELFISQAGHIPLPPYIERSDESGDAERYQTIYAKHSGSAAAPTAGLHFTARLLEEIKAQGVEIATIVLHVGLGTFRPVTCKDIRQHKMHREFYQVSEETASRLNQAREKGGRITAVGTTVVRTLETIYDINRGYQAGQGETDCFIYPGYEIKAIDRLITNFHLPGSSLLMLVSAFLGVEKTRQAYGHAIEEKYRFFSYGDAMLIC